MGAALIPLAGAALGPVISGIEGLVGGDPNKPNERASAIQALQQQAAAGDPGAIQSLEEWATGTQVPGASQNRFDEPSASRAEASQALQSLGLNVPAQYGNSGTGQGSSVPGVAAGLGAAGGVAGGGTGSAINSLLTGLAAGAGGLTAANQLQQQQNLYNKALQEAQQNYSQTAPLRAQGVQGIQSTMANVPNLSTQFATPSNPFSAAKTAAPPPIQGTPVPGVAAGA